MEDNKDNVNFEEVFDSEMDDIWDIFFPYMMDTQEKIQRLEEEDKSKPRRYLRFLTM